MLQGLVAEDGWCFLDLSGDDHDPLLSRSNNDFDMGCVEEYYKYSDKCIITFPVSDLAKSINSVTRLVPGLYREVICTYNVYTHIP